VIMCQTGHDLINKHATKKKKKTNLSQLRKSGMWVMLS